MAIGEICNRDVVFAPGETSARGAAELMRGHHVGTVVVVNDTSPDRRVPLGIVTDRDLVVAIVAKGLDPESIRLDALMAPDLLTVRETDGIAETIERMRTKGTRRMPVVDASGALLGIVTADDLIDLLAEELTGLARMMAREQKREAEVRKG